MSKQGQWTREEALKSLVASLTYEQITDLCSIIETADTQGDYVFDGEGSIWEDSVNATLWFLANEFRKAKQ